jgi:hypothetical protein
MQSVILQAHIDESSDREQENVLCVGGILAHPVSLAAIQSKWLERLKFPDEIDYFRATDCRRVDGAFFKLRNKYGSGAQAVADKIRGDLEGILLSYSWIGFGIGVLIPDYREIWNSFPTTRRFYRRDPAEAAYAGLFFEIARAAQKNAPDHRVAYIIDDSTYSGMISDAFDGVKINHPEVGRAMLSTGRRKQHGSTQTDRCGGFTLAG